MNSTDYIKYIKKQSCCVCGRQPCDADHLNARGMGGANKSGLKDYSCVPLCRKHHIERHSFGIEGIQEKYNINLWRDAWWYLKGYFIKCDLQLK